MHHYKKKILICLSLLAFFVTQAQQTINYITGFGNPDNVSNTCNLFNQNTLYTIASFKHWPVSGGVTRIGGSPIELKTRGGTSTTTTRGTAYAIEYPIKSGYSYRIVLNAYRSNTQTNPIVSFEVAARPALPIPNNDGTNPGACGSVVFGQLTAVQLFRISSTNFAVSNPNASNLTAVNNWVAPENRSFFTLLAYGGNIGEDASVYINSVTITETPPPSNFSISPSPYNLSCGTTVAQTFTISNLNNTPNVTGYTWNLGANNGWLFNGSPAPATISTGTNNTLELTPACGIKPNNFSATVTTTISSAQTNTVNVSVSPPTNLSISGSSTICSGSTDYTINGLVCNSTISWTTPPSGVASLSNLSSSPTTLTYGGTPGTFTLTANVTSCGVTAPVTLPIQAGSYASSFYTMSGGNSTTQPLYWCPGQTYSFNVNGPGSNYVWTAPPGWTVRPSGPAPNYKAYRAPSSTSPPTGSVSVTFTEPCGTTITKSFFVAYSQTACTGTDPRFTFSPNPAPSYINVSVASGYTGTVYINRIQIVSTTTGLTVFDQTYSGNTSNAYITTSGFQAGTYNLRIYDGSTWAVYQFIR
jgi:hypothetical protein